MCFFTKIGGYKTTSFSQLVNKLSLCLQGDILFTFGLYIRLKYNFDQAVNLAQEQCAAVDHPARIYPDRNCWALSRWHPNSFSPFSAMSAIGCPEPRKVLACKGDIN